MEIKENTSLNQLVQEYNKKQDNIEKLRKEFESYLNKEEIYKIIKKQVPKFFTPFLSKKGKMVFV